MLNVGKLKKLWTPLLTMLDFFSMHWHKGLLSRPAKLVRMG